MQPILHRAVSVAFALAALGLISLSTVFAPALERSFRTELAHAEPADDEKVCTEPTWDAITRPGDGTRPEHRAATSTPTDHPAGFVDEGSTSEAPALSFSSVTVVRVSALGVAPEGNVRVWQWPREARGR
jgi:hypothetical protein